MKSRIKIGTRGSKLALIQANLVKTIIKQKFIDSTINLKIIKTKGDKILNSPLSQIGDKGLFTKELEDGLIKKEIDIAIHSLKDMPTELPDSLILGAVLKRGFVEDVLISRQGKCLNELGPKDTIATSSLRRKAQLLKFNPDFNIIDIRGNIDTRIKKMKTGYCDSIILAAAGIHRTGCENEITEYIKSDIMMPAACQGIIGMEIRKDDRFIINVLKKINHKETLISAHAERAFLKRLEGGCQVPIGCITSINGEKFNITGIISNLEGNKVIKKSRNGTLKTAVEISAKLAKSIFDDGGEDILNEIRAGN